MNDVLDCLGVRVAMMDWSDFRDWFAERMRHDLALGPARLYLVNAHTLNLAHADAAYHDVITAGTLVLNDGAGIEFAARLAGKRLRYNFNGTDLLPRLFQEISAEGGHLRVFLYGGVPERAEEAAMHIHERYPGIEVVGTRHGYESDDESVITSINAAAPDLVLVAKGNPLQEQWIHAFGWRLRARVIVGVGALFDFLSGRMPRAPELLREAKMEWLYRLCLEPRRLARRYVVGNPTFIGSVMVYQAKRAYTRVSDRMSDASLADGSNES